MHQHSGNFVVCLEEKLLFQNCAAPLKGGDSCPVKVKSAGILGGLRAFLPRSGADKRLLEAVYHYGASPKDEAALSRAHITGGKAGPCTN